MGTDPLFPGQVGNGIVERLLIGNQIPQSGFRSLTAQILQKLQQVLSMFFSYGLLFPAAVLCQADSLPGLKPQSCRKHGADGIVKGAEVPLPDESRQPQLPLRQDRCLVQASFDRLQACFLSRFHTQDNALGAFVGTSEGQLDPHARQNRHVLRDTVGIGPVNGKIRRRNSNFPDHKPLP